MKASELKKELRKLGLKIYLKKGSKTQASFVRKGDVKKVLAGPVVDIKTGKEIDPNAKDTKEYGFDLTDIPEAKWKELLKLLGITAKATNQDGWQWKGDGILLVTANNPLTGVYYSGAREPEKGYASYIGIEGDSAKVDLAVDFIRKHGNSKDESDRREFI